MPSKKKPRPPADSLASFCSHSCDPLSYRLLVKTKKNSAFGASHFTLLSWLPTFYNQAFGVDVGQSAALSVLPWLCTVAVSSSSGVLADYLVNSGRLDVTRTRKLLQVTGGILPAVCFFALADAHDADSLSLGAALALLTGGVALGGFQSAGFAANHQDIASARWAPLLFGVTNALSSLVGSASVYATGGLLDAGYGWGAVYTGLACTYLAGAVGYAALGSGERQFD
jgi:ACS family sodium-dependent inorganic phosphate cotransporter